MNKTKCFTQFDMKKFLKFKIKLFNYYILFKFIGKIIHPGRDALFSSKGVYHFCKYACTPAQLGPEQQHLNICKIGCLIKYEFLFKF